ncbi:MAG: hypothetical protein ABJF10_00990 [Chthoniobacter sp.]|uniref:hypothetical protein n=1 Tax=Chthoniobacter sp. TaxID=2510640 RepID=UPI0032A9DC4A
MTRLLLPSLAVALAGLVSACAPINVMGRSVPDSEYIALYDRGIAREKRGLKPDDAHDEHGRPPSWDEYWCGIGGTGPVPPTMQSRRLKRYIITHRRALGLPELSGARD